MCYYWREVIYMDVLTSLLRAGLALFLALGQAFVFVVAASNSAATLDTVPDSHYRDASAALCDPDATPEARALMAWLKAQYGTYTLSGNYISPYNDYSRAVFRDADGNLDVRLSNELFVVSRVTGKYPAILGLDYTNVELPGWRDWMTLQALQWHGLGGIVTFCWHWKIPKNPEALAKPFESMNGDDAAFYTKDIGGFDLAAVLADPESRYHQWILHSIDAVATQLLRLQEAGVPVLWRPLHEAAGGWFWWGTDREACIELYKLVYERLVNTHGLHNLIWVWNGQNPHWYPGDEYVDMLADDPYNDNFLDRGFSRRFKYTRRAAPGKMVGMSENNKLFRLDSAWAMNTKWLYFVLWDREMILKCDPDPANNPEAGGDGFLREYLDKYNSEEALRETYNDERVITLDGMPRW